LYETEIVYVVSCTLSPKEISMIYKDLIYTTSFEIWLRWQSCLF